MIATRTSLSTMTGTPLKAAEMVDPRGTSCRNPATFEEFATLPVAGSTVPGVPMPMARTSPPRVPAAPRASLAAATISSITACASVCGVAWRAWPTTSPSTRATVWIFVPPRSTPIVTVAMGTMLAGLRPLRRRGGAGGRRGPLRSRQVTLVSVVGGGPAVPMRSDVVVLFGATGDLAKKKLFPALYLLSKSGRLSMPVVGVAKSDWDETTFRDHAREDVIAAYPDADREVLGAMLDRLSLVNGDYADHDTFEHLADTVHAAGGSRALHYLAIPPSLFGPVIESLGKV